MNNEDLRKLKENQRLQDEKDLELGIVTVDDLRKRNGLGYGLSYKHLRIGERKSGNFDAG